MSQIAALSPVVNRPASRCAAKTDYRWKLTRKVLKILRDSRPVVVIGGPKMGKTHLLNEVQRSAPSYLALDNVSPAMVPSVLSRNIPVLLTTDISFLEASRLLGDEVFKVPLTTIIPKHLERWPQTSWSECRGHPNLTSILSEEERKERYIQLQHAWRYRLASHPTARQVCAELTAMGASVSPVERYQILRSRYGRQTKRLLDWLVCLGMIHRQKYTRGAAGIMPVFTI